MSPKRGLRFRLSGFQDFRVEGLGFRGFGFRALRILVLRARGLEV